MASSAFLFSALFSSFFLLFVSPFAMPPGEQFTSHEAVNIAIAIYAVFSIFSCFYAFFLFLVVNSSGKNSWVINGATESIQPPQINESGKVQKIFDVQSKLCVRYHL